MNRVSGYTLSTCPWCRKTKKFFADHGISFDYVDYDLQTPEEQAKIEKEMIGAGDTMAFPWVRINGQVVVGWDPEKYSELLGLDPGA